MAQYFAVGSGADQLGNGDQAFAHLPFETALGNFEEDPATATHHYHDQEDKTEHQLVPNASMRLPPLPGFNIFSDHALPAQRVFVAILNVASHPGTNKIYFISTSLRTRIPWPVCSRAR